MPSASDMTKPSASQQGQRSPTSVRRRKSLCPPVGPTARPAMKRRGPGASPSSTAWRKPQSAPPVSRTDVKPRFSIARSDAIACAVISVTGCVSSRGKKTSFRTMCTWQSIRPGISVRPPQSTTSALSARIGRSETSRISLSSTRISRPPIGSSCSGSSIEKFLRRVCPICTMLPDYRDPACAIRSAIRLRIGRASGGAASRPVRSALRIRWRAAHGFHAGRNP